MHCAMPLASAKEPARQLTQLMLPTALWALPNAQLWHTTAPCTSLNFPAGHSTAGALPPAQDEPAGQLANSATTVAELLTTQVPWPLQLPPLQPTK